MVVTEHWNLPSTVVSNSCGIRCLLHSHHLSSTSMSAVGTAPSLCPTGLSSSFVLPASLGSATKLLLGKGVTTGCGHHTREGCHLLESCRLGLVLCHVSPPSLLPGDSCTLKVWTSKPWGGGRPPPSFRDLGGLAISGPALPRKDWHTHVASCPHTSPEGWLI